MASFECTLKFLHRNVTWRESVLFKLNGKDTTPLRPSSMQRCVRDFIQFCYSLSSRCPLAFGFHHLVSCAPPCVSVIVLSFHLYSDVSLSPCAFCHCASSCSPLSNHHCNFCRILFVMPFGAAPSPAFICLTLSNPFLFLLCVVPQPLSVWSPSPFMVAHDQGSSGGVICPANFATAQQDIITPITTSASTPPRDSTLVLPLFLLCHLFPPPPPPSPPPSFPYVPTCGFISTTTTSAAAAAGTTKMCRILTHSPLSLQYGRVKEEMAKKSSAGDEEVHEGQSAMLHCPVQQRVLIL